MTHPIVELFKQATTKTAKAPSGLTYRARGLTPTESVEVRGGFASIAPKKGPSGQSEEKDIDPVKAQEQNNKMLARYAEVQFPPTLEWLPLTIGDDGRGMPVEAMTAGDQLFVLNLINVATGIAGPAAEEARRFLRESGSGDSAGSPVPAVSQASV